MTEPSERIMVMLFVVTLTEKTDLSPCLRSLYTLPLSGAATNTPVPPNAFQIEDAGTAVVKSFEAWLIVNLREPKWDV